VIDGYELSMDGDGPNMTQVASGRTWDEAEAPGAARLARRFEAAWREGTRPDLASFLPDASPERPAVLLALLRADMGLKAEAGEIPRVEAYLGRFPVDISGEVLVGLAYEEFCLREDAGEQPEPAEYLARFPEASSALRRVLDIHGLVGSGTATTTHEGDTHGGVAFPEAGQTIGGFHLVEELGRGAFARVFLARERQLADRHVALKVSRTGSREPQTLARLQHTNIVPVHSYRVDPATGLHLLCMPYFGGLTLARLLACQAGEPARSGADLVARLDQVAQQSGAAPSGRSTARAALARRTYPRAVAWWAARMAEALEHAHDRGVLHRDVKPSNVLLTGDGLPMLLDFNLARESVAGDSEAPATMGGTFDYMAPEHLEALADGLPDEVDARSDVYSLGILMYETLTGARPFSSASKARTLGETLLRAADERRRVVASPRAARPDIPPDLDAVVRRCLAADRSHRYANATELADDLRAVADDMPLKHAREPMPSRSRRWARRNRRALTVSIPLILALVVAGVTAWRVRDDRIQSKAEAKSEVKAAIADAVKAIADDNLDLAVERFKAARKRALPFPEFWEDLRTAREGLAEAEETRAIRAQAEAFLSQAGSIRFVFLNKGGDLVAAARGLERLIEPFFQFSGTWERRGVLSLLEQRSQLPRLEREVDELLFLWALKHDTLPDGTSRRTFALAHRFWSRAAVFAIAPRPDSPTDSRSRATSASKPRSQPVRTPWAALRTRLDPNLAATRTAGPSIAPPPGSPGLSPRACFQWAMLKVKENRRGDSIDYLTRATRDDPGNAWYHSVLAMVHDSSGSLADGSGVEHDDLALQHDTAAVAIEPDSPYFRFSLAQHYRRRNAYELALVEFKQARADFARLPTDRQDPAFSRRYDLEIGIVQQQLGNAAEARKVYDDLTRRLTDDIYARAARINLAKLDVDTGALDHARTIYDDLLAMARTKAGARSPVGTDLRDDDTDARLGRALLGLLQGRAAEAEADLNLLLGPKGLAANDLMRRADAMAHRAKARLMLGNDAEALSDARLAELYDPSPSHRRLANRAALALGVDDLRIHRPEDLILMPLAGPELKVDLRRAADRLARRKYGAGDPADDLRARLSSALILSTLGDHAAAEVDASKALAVAPLNARAFLVRARVRRRAGRLPAAMADVDNALLCEPDEPRLLEFRGLLLVEMGRPHAAKAELDRALSRGAERTIHAVRARVFDALGRRDESVAEWQQALLYDPEDPRNYLGRARAWLSLGKRDQALADLEGAAAWSSDHPSLILPITWTYALGLQSDRTSITPRDEQSLDRRDRLSRIPRLLDLIKRSLISLTRAHTGLASSSPLRSGTPPGSPAQGPANAALTRPERGPYNRPPDGRVPDSPPATLRRPRDR
jgi:serine/threonine protein kinase/tetratricopeptide (TPR) repeat protein